MMQRAVKVGRGPAVGTPDSSLLHVCLCLPLCDGPSWKYQDFGAIILFSKGIKATGPGALFSGLLS